MFLLKMSCLSSFVNSYGLQMATIRIMTFVYIDLNKYVLGNLSLLLLFNCNKLNTSKTVIHLNINTNGVSLISLF